MQATTAEHVRRVADALEEVGDETRLADSRGAQEREEPARAVGDRVLVIAPEALTLTLSSDQRRLEVPRDRIRVDKHLDEPECLDGRRLALERERFDRFDARCVPNERSRLGADQRLTRRGRLLESRCDIDRITGDERVVATADHDLTGVHADACLEPVLGDRRAHLRRGADRTQRIVFV